MEIEKERKKLYPIMKKAKEEGKKVQLVRDKLFINNQLFITHEQRRTKFRDVVMAGPPLNQSPPIPPRKRKKKTRTAHSKRKKIKSLNNRSHINW